MAGIAFRNAFEIILMFRFRFPEIAGRRHFRHHLAGPQPGRVHIGNGVLGDAFLFVVRVEDGRAVTAAEIVALAVARGRVVDLEEEFQQSAIADLAGSKTISMDSAWVPWLR